MRQFSIVFLLISLILLTSSDMAYSAIRGKIDYSIPIDYSKLSETELSIKAQDFYYKALTYEDNILTEDMTDALLLYSILENMNPDHVEYSVRLGVLNDKIGKDRLARGHFAKAIGINSKYPDSYFYYGEYYYKRNQYRRALKLYNEAYKHGFDKDFDTLFRIGSIYEKFGDTRSALKYLRDAQALDNTPVVEEMIKRIEIRDPMNKEYYSDTRIRTPQMHD